MSILISFLLFPLVNEHFHVEDHALYLAVVEMDQTADQSWCNLSIKVFSDDLENTLRHFKQQPIDLLLNKDCTSHRTLIQNYFADHLKIVVDQMPVELTYVGCEIAKEVSWLQFRIPMPKQVRSLEITADFFMELFPTQSNMIYINKVDQKRFLRVTKQNPTATTRFD